MSIREPLIWKSLNTQYLHAYKILEFASISVGSPHQILTWWQKDHHESKSFQTKKNLNRCAIDGEIDELT